MNQGALFKVCRRALKLSVRGMQATLCIADERTVRRIEHGDIDVLGQTWVALGFLLREAGINDLAERVEGVCASLRDRNTTCPERDDRLG